MRVNIFVYVRFRRRLKQQHLLSGLAVVGHYDVHLSFQHASQYTQDGPAGSCFFPVQAWNMLTKKSYVTQNGKCDK